MKTNRPPSKLTGPRSAPARYSPWALWFGPEAPSSEGSSRWTWKPRFVMLEHLLLALLAQPEELAARALEALGVTTEAVRVRVVERLPPSPPRPGGSLGVAPQTKRLLELARTLARRLGHRCARTEHLLLAAVSPALKSPAGTVLADCGADAARVSEQLASMLEIEAPELAARLRPRRP